LRLFQQNGGLAQPSFSYVLVNRKTGDRLKQPLKMKGGKTGFRGNIRDIHLLLKMLFDKFDCALNPLVVIHTCLHFPDVLLLLYSREDDVF